MKDINTKDLIIFKGFADNETIRKAVSLFSSYNKDNYIFVQREMIEHQNKKMKNSAFCVKTARTCWQDYIIDILAKDQNIFSLSAEKDVSLAGTKILDLARSELAIIKQLYGLDFDRSISHIKENDMETVNVQNIAADLSVGGSDSDRKESLEEVLKTSDDKNAISLLYDYFRNNGCGIMENFSVFRWNSRDCRPEGVENHDAVEFDDLIGYEAEKQKLIKNTEALMNGKKAANVLLYGDSGTGKSSSVKALVNKYKDKGLKMISIDKNQIDDLPFILDYTEQRGCKFIILIDDLSFEENETGYKNFKSVLEGNVKSKPDNTVIYVTSNRKNIVREVWSERESSDDIHLEDTLQEKRSLSDRFGLIIIYRAPDKQEYLAIIRGLAEKKHLDVTEELLSDALKWEIRRSGRSGRAARYFIDQYIYD